MTAAIMMHRSRLMACTIFFAFGTTNVARAQDAAPVSMSAPSESAMVNLVRLLVKQGILKPAAGDALMKQAEAEAVQAQFAAKAATATQTAAAALPDAAPGSIRVPYIPATVRAQIRDEIRTEVLAQAKAEGWASADEAAPEWTKRISLFGDFRLRSQSELFSKTNSSLIFDFARINAQGPTDLLNNQRLLPTLNASVDRVNRLRLRGRLGVNANLGGGVSAVFAVATGDDNSPISTNQSLGGGLAKRDLWLDQAYLKLAPSTSFEASFGRFPNPFVSTDLLFDEDLRFDGVAAQFNAGQFLSDDVTLSIRGGAFPLDFGSGDFPNTQQQKQKAPVRYLYSGQIAVGATFAQDIQVNAAVAYHSFQGVRGQLGPACNIYQGITECPTDATRVAFPRKGNTLFGIRQFAVDPGFVPSVQQLNQPLPQLLGLVFDYDILNINGSVRVPVSDGVVASVTGDYVRNLSFKKGDACRFGVQGPFLNNGGEGENLDACAALNPRPFAGGPTGYLVKAFLGHEKIVKRWEWSVFAGYRYLESDAVLDSLTDSDFHLGGTNAKGYFVGGKLGLYDNVTLGGRWLSANQVSGTEPFAIDVLQIDLEAKF